MFLPRTISARNLIPLPSNLLSIHFTTQDTTSCLDHQRKKWLRHGVIHSSHNTNPLAKFRTMNHLKSIDDALNQRSTRHWLEFGPNQLHFFKNSASQSTSQTKFSANKGILCASNFAFRSRISAHIAHDLVRKESRNVLRHK